VDPTPELSRRLVELALVDRPAQRRPGIAVGVELEVDERVELVLGERHSRLGEDRRHSCVGVLDEQCDRLARAEIVERACSVGGCAVAHVQQVPVAGRAEAQRIVVDDVLALRIELVAL
jgi:hypothetical protein